MADRMMARLTGTGSRRGMVRSRGLACCTLAMVMAAGWGETRAWSGDPQTVAPQTAAAPAARMPTPANSTAAMPTNAPPATVSPGVASPAKPQRHFVVQLRIIEVDEQGQQTVIAQPVLQTTGTTAGVMVEADNGRQFEVQFAAVGPQLPVPAGNAPPQPPGTAPVLSAVPATGADLATEPRISVKAVQQPGKTVLRDMARQAGLMIVMERESAEAVTSQLATPVNLELTNVPLDQALKQLVTPLALEYAVRQDMVLIGCRPAAGDSTLPTTTLPATTKMVAPGVSVAPGPIVPGPVVPPQQPEPELALPTDDWKLLVYGVSDLLIASDSKAAGESEAVADFEPLIRQIRASVVPETWSDDGSGGGTIRGFQSTRSLVVRQSSAGHAALADFLARMRRQQPGTERK